MRWSGPGISSSDFYWRPNGFGMSFAISTLELGIESYSLFPDSVFMGWQLQGRYIWLLSPEYWIMLEGMEVSRIF